MTLELFFCRIIPPSHVPTSQKPRRTLFDEACPTRGNTMPVRSFGFALLTLLFVFCTVKPISAQQAATSSAPSADQTDARVFATFFRRENNYLRMAKAAPSPDKPEAHLNRVIPQQFQIDAIDSSSLEQVAANWERDTEVLRSQFLKVIAQFHGSFPNGRLKPGVDPTPPSALTDLRAQMDAVTLQYRDKLRNSMREPDFQRLRSNIWKAFANNPQTNTSSGTTPSATGVAK